MRSVSKMLGENLSKIVKSLLTMMLIALISEPSEMQVI